MKTELDKKARVLALAKVANETKQNPHHKRIFGSIPFLKCLHAAAAFLYVNRYSCEIPLHMFPPKHLSLSASCPDVTPQPKTP